MSIMTESSEILSLSFLDDVLSGGKKWISKCENLSILRSSFSLLPTPANVSIDVQEKVFIALASCLEFEPNLWRFAQHFLIASHPPFQRFVNKNASSLEPPPVKKNKSELKPASDECILKCCLTFLNCDTHFQTLWSWQELLSASPDLSNDAKWLAVECLGRVSNWSEKKREEIFRKLFSGQNNFDALSVNFLLDKGFHENPECLANELSIQNVVYRTVAVHGQHLMKDILTTADDDQLDVEENQKLGEFTFVSVASRERDLIKIIEAIGESKPVMLEGPMGSGKTKLVEEVARLANRKEFKRFHRVYMSDRTDGRSLVGGYTCHDVPGNFNWEDGVLTRAVKAGDWLLIEDVHLAPSDVMSTLLPLIERRQLHVPSRGVVIQASPGFQLFLTQRTDSGRLSLVKGTCHINVQDFADQELTVVCAQLYPSLETIANKMVACFVALRTRQNSCDIAAARKRLFSVRDLKKWCMRCNEVDLASLDNETIVLEGFDCFCNHISAASGSAAKIELMRGIGQMFNLTRESIDHLALERFPALTKTRDAIKVGRTSIRRKVVDENRNRRPFYLTRQASRLVEFLASAINRREPILLVGETGVGKTSSVQFLCDLLGKRLVTVNLNQQTESSDLLGGFKPVDFEHFVLPVRQRFENLFRQTFSSKENAKFLSHLSECQARKRWSDLVQLMIHAAKGATKRDVQTKEWKALEGQLDQLKKSLTTQAKLLFSFVNGVLTDAVQKGEWILLDEINMADTEVLECLSEVMDPEIESLCLYGGSEKLIQKHPDFRVFACMNPATDVGKKELPDGLRNRFTEYFIEEPNNEQDLLLVVQDYLKNLAPTLDLKVFKQVVRFFFSVKQLADKKLLDGTGHKPTYSLRTLCRALDIASQNFCQNPKRSLLEAFLMCFLTELDRSSYPVVFSVILKHFGKSEAVTSLKTSIAKPPTGLYVNIEGYWLSAGEKIPVVPEDFILTETVRQNLKDVARIVSLSHFAVLLQGETSVGKTSLITYLSKATGNTCLRINNHEHTDIQEYVGAYCMDHKGNFTFQEGVLALAMRMGYWIILDELNLAPSDVLEALNRVLDDNRELFVPETQTLIKAHSSFRIFATQNPSGSSYGGRKFLSRAFRNRFVELHFSELPSSELCYIIEKRCKIATKAAKKLIAVMHDLQMTRKSSAALEGKRGYLTLRDLFRWADRCSLADQPTQFYDWERHFAEEGFLVLASKVRHPTEAETVQQCLEKVFKRNIDPEELYNLSASNKSVTRDDVLAILNATSDSNEDIVWTRSAIRMAVITLHSLRFKEPVLLVGETGCGKTQICQTLARVLSRALVSINCHLNTESSDFLGGLRPNRSISEGDEALFHWVDGPLIQAMTDGSVLLVDEISLADDSVLERMNSILEPERTLLLIEETSTSECRQIVAHTNFQFVATMNPGGDFGKKELSPALRNRLVEIWCPSEASGDDLAMITKSKLVESVDESVVGLIVDFVLWYRSSRVGVKVPFTLRDLLGWVSFINRTHSYLDLECSFVHGICLVIFDGLGSFLTGEPLSDMKESGRKFFLSKFPNHSCDCFNWITSTGGCNVLNTDQRFQIGPFGLEKKVSATNRPTMFHFGAPTVSKNTLKILRALQIDNKAVLLEGLPGVGKSSLVEALAKMTGNSLVRINLSDQTEISDLFGADLPTESGSCIASFSWHDGPFLAALKAGHWILLDELNLATQSVLEGLNACLDHRGTIFIPELNRSFEISQNKTRIFGCQNPPRDGGDRKNLPKSFLNRFVKVYLSEFEPTDLILICRHQFPSLDDEVVPKLVEFAIQLHQQTCVEKAWGYSGSPWQFNLRDLLRWCEAVSADPRLAFRYAELVFVQRFRMQCDKSAAIRCLNSVIETDYKVTAGDLFYIDKNVLRVGSAVLQRSNKSLPSLQRHRLLYNQYEALESLMLCVKNNWVSILVGQSGTGKSSLVNLLSDLTGHPLHSITLTSASDTSELLGGFEQTGPYEKLASLAHQLVHQVTLDLELFCEDPQLTSRLVQLQMRLSRIRDDNLDLTELESIFATYDDVIKSKTSDNVEWKRRLSMLKENTNKIGFEWMDSVLIRAVKNGDWLLLDDANLCNSAVLDRLNSLLEPNGILVIGERGCSDENGKIPTVVPHPDFRLFLTMNPQQGELSPAVRNRCVEIFIDQRLEEAKNDVSDECLVTDLSTYSSTTLLLRQSKLLQELIQVKGMQPSIAAKSLLLFSTLEDLLIREIVFTRHFKMRSPELFQNLGTLLSAVKTFNISDVRCSVEVAAFVEAVFAVELLLQKSNSANFSLSIKQLWSLLVTFATKFFSDVTSKLLTLEKPNVNETISLAVISNLFQSMKSRLNTAESDSIIMKQWSLAWLRLQNVLPSTITDPELSKIEREISLFVRPFFSAFNLSVRDFWGQLGLPVLSSASLQILEERKSFQDLSLKLAVTNKTELASVCDQVNRMSKSISNNVDSLTQIFDKLPLQDKPETQNALSSNDVFKLHFSLVSAWNAYLKNIAVSLNLGQRLGSSILFPLESIDWLRNVNKSNWSKEDAFEFKPLSVQQVTVIQHIFKLILAAKRESEPVFEADAEKKDEDDAEMVSLTQLMSQISMDKKDLLDVEISSLVERKRQLAAIQTQLVVDCRDVVKYELSSEKAKMEFCIETFLNILRGIDSLEVPTLYTAQLNNDLQAIVSFSSALKTKIEASNFFPKHLQTIVSKIISMFQQFPDNHSIVRLCSGLLLLHISTELGYVDISEHMTATAEAIEAEVASMTWVMIAEDSCNSLVRFDEPLPVRPTQSERRQMLGNYVKNQVSAWQKAVENIPKRHPAEPFDNLAQELDQLKTSLISVETVTSLAASLLNVAEEFCEERLKSWKLSVLKFIAEFKSKFSSYRDITIPVLASVADVMTSLQELKTLRQTFVDIDACDKLRYLLLEIDSLPEKNLDVVIASGKGNSSTLVVDVVRDLGKSWLASQASNVEDSADAKSTPKSVVFHFRDAEEPEETAERLEEENKFSESGTEKQLLRTLFQSLKGEKANNDEAVFSHGHFKDIYFQLLTALAGSKFNATNAENAKLYFAHCQAVNASLASKPTETEKLRPLMDEMKSFVEKNVAPYNEEHPVLEGINRMIGDVLKRSQLEPAKSFLVPIENLILNIIEWNKHVPRNQIIPHRELARLVINWRKDHLTWPSIRQDIDEHMLLAIHDCALALWPVIEDALVGGKSGCSKKSIIAPFVLFFTAAFVGDFVERLKVVERLAQIFVEINPEAARVLNTVIVYFRHFAPAMEKKIADKLKKTKQKFEVFRKAGKLFEEEKMRLHFKDTTKVRRDTTFQILTILKEPAMKLANRLQPQNEVTECVDPLPSLFDAINAEVEVSKSVVFVSDKGTELGGVKELGEKSRGLLKNMDSVFKKKAAITEELSAKRDQLEALHTDLKRPASGDKKLGFHPTQTSITNMLADVRQLGLRPLYGARFDLRTIHLLAEIQVPQSSSDVLVDEMTYFMFKFEELKESFYCPDKCAKAFPACQKGYDQLSHGMLQILKHQRTVVKAKEELKEVRKVVKNLRSVETNLKKLWSDHLVQILKRLAQFCERMTSILSNVSGSECHRMFEINFDVAGLKTEAEKVSCVLVEYAKSVEILKSILRNDSKAVEGQEDIVNENVVKLQRGFEKLSVEHPNFTSGILLQFESLHAETVSKISLMQTWKSSLSNAKRALPEKLFSKFEADLKSASTQCLVALQEASKSFKKLDLVEDDENSGFMISAYDRAVAGFKSLKVASVLSDFGAISCFVELCEKQKFDVDPLLSQIKMFAPVFDVYFDYVQSLIRHCELMGQATCRYLSQCCVVLKAFLLYDFGKIEQEDGKEGEMTKDLQGTGLGDGQADEATTNDLESEDVFEGAEKPKRPDEEDEEKADEEEEKTKEEDGVELSGDLDAQMQEKEENDKDENEDSDEDDQDEEMLDKEEGETDPDKGLDEQVWNDEEQEKEEQDDKEEEELNKDNRENESSKENKNDPRGESNPDEKDDQQQQQQQKEEEEKRDRKEDEGVDEAEAEEVDMKDKLFGDENLEPPEPEDLDLGDDIDMDEQENGDDNEEDDLDPEPPIEKLPDFADQIPEDEDDGKEKDDEDLEEAGDDPAGHDRQDSNPADECKNKPMTTEQEDEKANDKTEEEEGTEFDGLQDENGQGESNKFDEMPEKETEKENDEKIGELEEKEPEKEEEKILEPEVTSQIDKKKLTQETSMEEENQNDSKVEQLFAHTKNVEKCTEKTVDRANEDDFDNNMDVDEVEDDRNDESKSEKVNHNVKKFEEMETVDTETVERSDETVLTKNDNFEFGARRDEISHMEVISDFRANVSSAELKEWLELCSSVHDLSQTLTEQLRLILEPTKATKFRGDFKSGKKLNMRKIIPFIASNYRKDKIWLRRTKPSKRDYFVMVAVDDSSSMNVNEVKKTTYQSLATLCGALSTLEVGKFGIMSFGNEPKLVHPLQPNFAHEDGAHLLKTLTFDQTATNVAKMLDMANKAFSNAGRNSDAAKLLLVLSDGRGIFNEGQDRVLDAVRNVLLAGTFIIFLIVENISNKDSVLDMRIATFDENNKPTIVSYMEQFPFPYYMILKNINALPQSLSDALRQWFTLVAN